MDASDLLSVVQHIHDCDTPQLDTPFQRFKHGARCDCLLLAKATHGGSDAVTFSYCVNVLQKRYVMSCRHGEAGPPAEVTKASARWQGPREIDAVKAILVTNS